MEVIGALGAIVGIVDVTTRSISTLTNLRDRYKEIEFTADFMCARLGIIKAALEQIHALITESLRQEQYYQLVMDLEFAIKCSNVLVRKLDEQIAQLEYDADKSLNFGSKVKMILESKGTEECLRMLDVQMGAFNCLITALNARDVMCQKAILEKKDTAKIFNKMRDDSSSLNVLCDSESFKTRCTSSTAFTSKFSINSFDIELLQHKAYKPTLKTLLKKSRLSSSKDAGGVDPTHISQDKILNPKQHQKRSAEIDALLAESSKDLRREVKILAFGQQVTSIISMWTKISGYPVDSVHQLLQRNLVYKHFIAELILCTEGLGNSYDAIVRIGSKFDSCFDILFAALSYQIDEKRWMELKNSIRYCQSVLSAVPLETAEFVKLSENLDRILEQDYEPTEDDINIASVAEAKRTKSFREALFDIANLRVRIIDGSFNVGERKKYIHMFEDVTCLLFTVDLAAYDNISTDDDPADNSVSCLLSIFDALVNDRWFQDSSIILLLMNVKAFTEKMKNVPFIHYFPGYDGGDDARGAANYILWLFEQTHRGDMRLRSHFCEVDDTRNVRLILNAVEDTIIERTIKRGRGWL